MPDKKPKRLRPGSQTLDDHQISHLKEIRLRELDKNYTKHTQQLRTLLNKFKHRRTPDQE